jgi:hypothetical protein
MIYVFSFAFGFATGSLALYLAAYFQIKAEQEDFRYEALGEKIFDI